MHTWKNSIKLFISGKIEFFTLNHTVNKTDLPTYIFQKVIQIQTS